MKFSIYSELQSWPGKPVAQLYGEVMEQVVNADRLGYDAYAIIEHYCFPKFSASALPTAFFAAAAQRTERINFRTLLHPLPYYNPVVLAAQIAETDLLVGGRYEWGVGRGHGWIPTRLGYPLDEDSVPRYDEAIDVLMLALENDTFSYRGKYFQIEESHVVPRPTRKFRIFLGGTSDHTYIRAGKRGWAVVVPPLLPYAALEAQLDLYRTTCAENGHEPDIVWIHACYLDEDRDVAIREAEQGMRQFLEGNASPLTEYSRPPADGLEAAGYGFYTAGVLEQLAETPYDQMIEQDVVWVGTPADVIERIEAVRDVCEGLTEVSITVNPGNFDHWQAIKAQELFAHRVMPHFGK